MAQDWQSHYVMIGAMASCIDAMVNHKGSQPEALAGWAWLSTTPLEIEGDKVDEPSHA